VSVRITRVSPSGEMSMEVMYPPPPILNGKNVAAALAEYAAPFMPASRTEAVPAWRTDRRDKLIGSLCC
jgi:hypothetical protein